MRIFTFFMSLLGLARGLSLVHKNVQVMAPPDFSAYHNDVLKLEETIDTINLTINTMEDDISKASGVVETGLETLDEAIDQASDIPAVVSVLTLAKTSLTQALELITSAQESATPAVTAFEKLPATLKTLDDTITKLEDMSKGMASSSLISAQTEVFASNFISARSGSHCPDWCGNGKWSTEQMCTFNACTGCDPCTTDETPCGTAAGSINDAELLLAGLGGVVDDTIIEKLETAQTITAGVTETMDGISSQAPSFLTPGFKAADGTLSTFSALVGTLQAKTAKITVALTTCASLIDELYDFIPLARCAGLCGEVPKSCGKL